MRLSTHILALSVILLLSLSVQAKPITFEFTAKVDSIQNDAALGNNVHVGDSISGSFTFETTVPDTNSSPDFGEYKLEAPLPTGVGFKFNIGTMTFIPDTSTSSAEMFVMNSYDDLVDLGQCCNAGTLANAVVDSIIITLVSPPEGPADTINSTLITDIAGSLNNFANKTLRIHGYSAGGSYNIDATVNSITHVDEICYFPAENSVRFEARVTEIYDSSTNGLAGTIGMGDIISGEYRYNPDTPPETNPYSYDVFYPHKAGDPDSGFILNIADTILSSKNTTSMFDIHVMDSTPDHFDVMTHGAAMLLPNGSVINSIYFGLSSDTGKAIDTTVLSEISPASLSLWDRKEIQLSGNHADGSYFNITAELTSVIEGPSVSNPGTSQLTISPASGIFIREQQFDILLVVQEELAYVTNINVNVVNDSVITQLTCQTGPLLSDNKQTIICPSSANLLNPGINTVSAEIGLYDGSILTNQATWEMLQ